MITISANHLPFIFKPKKQLTYKFPEMRIRSFLLALCLLSVSATFAKVTTFDFSTIDEDGKIYGYTISNARNFLGGDASFTLDDINISFDLNDAIGSYETPGPIITNNSTFNAVYLEFGYSTSAGSFVFKTTDGSKISKIEIEFTQNYGPTWDTSMKEWSCSVGKFTDANHGSWTGLADVVTFDFPRENVDDYNTRYTRINSISITTSSSQEQVVSVADIAAAKQMTTNTSLKFECEFSCLAQGASGEYTLVSDGTNLMYLHSQKGLQIVKAGEKINSGVCGTIADIDGVCCLEIDESSFECKMNLSPERINLARLSDEYIGKMVKIYGGIIKNDNSIATLSQGETTVVLNNLLLASTPTTVNNYVEVVGIVGKSGAEYIIQPMSIVESLYTSEDVVDTIHANVYVDNGAIVIDGEFNTSCIFDANGVLIARDKRVVECQPGLYLVSIDGVTIAKVIIQ